jgi:hypothetical protein
VGVFGDLFRFAANHYRARDFRRKHGLFRIYRIQNLSEVNSPFH